MIEHDICPKCGSDDTMHEDDFLYDRGYTLRTCEKCITNYRVYRNMTPTKIVVEVYE